MSSTTQGAPPQRRRPSLVRRIFLSLALVSSLASVVVLLFATSVYQRTALDDTGRMLEDECRLVRSAMGDAADPARLATLDLNEVRLTYIASDGTVLYDNHANVAQMDNHADRPEVVQAQQEGEGAAKRQSATTGMVSVYRAVLLDDGSVLRLSVDRDGVTAVIMGDIGVVVTAVVVLIAVCWLLSHLLAGRLIRPVLGIDPSHPAARSTYVEVMPLVERLSEQQAALEEQVDELRGADLMRREFTSNVTHELKTPLASISGAAELIRDGIAKPHDVPEFAGRIYDEAAHMIELVNDILTLSKLDESERAGDRALVGASEPVDLLHVLLDVRRSLKTTAEAAHVKLGCGGEPVVVRGVPSLLYELAFNLCDNAIHYNRKGGRVDAWAGIEDGQPTLRVSDTGVGIPKASQSKVFERFYRVDSSRARSTGGTGLGLAIVKHAATYHDAQISLESKEGSGTTITVRFPASCLLDESNLS